MSSDAKGHPTGGLEAALQRSDVASHGESKETRGAPCGDRPSRRRAVVEMAMFPKNGVANNQTAPNPLKMKAFFWYLIIS